MSERDPFDRHRIDREAELLDNLERLGGVTLRRPRKTVGFERRLERADDRPRTSDGGYIGWKADE